MLHLKNVRKTYIEPGGGQLPILDLPEFKLEAGEQMVLVGRSGSGKTTLLHIIAGITRADSGEVIINDIDIVPLPEAGRDRFRAHHLGYVFQTFNLLSAFTALENVLLGMTFGGKGTDPQRARDMLERVGLGDRLTHKPAQLSVGEQQRVSVARALANRPKLLLADEPTANVDPGNQQHIVNLIRETCHEENVALLMVTHADDVAGQFDRVDHLAELNRVAQRQTSTVAAYERPQTNSNPAPARSSS